TAGERPALLRRASRPKFTASQSALENRPQCVRLEVFLMFWAPFHLNFLCLIVFLVASFRLAVVAQSRVQDDKSTNSGQAASATGQERDPLKRPLSKKQQKNARDD